MDIVNGTDADKERFELLVRCMEYIAKEVNQIEKDCPRHNYLSPQVLK
jgi:hypothetical protein